MLNITHFKKFEKLKPYLKPGLSEAPFDLASTSPHRSYVCVSMCDIATLALFVIILLSILHDASRVKHMIIKLFKLVFDL